MFFHAANCRCEHHHRVANHDGRCAHNSHDDDLANDNHDSHDEYNHHFALADLSDRFDCAHLGRIKCPSFWPKRRLGNRSEADHR